VRAVRKISIQIREDADVWSLQREEDCCSSGRQWGFPDGTEIPSSFTTKPATALSAG